MRIVRVKNRILAFLPFLWMSAPIFALNEQAVEFCKNPKNLCSYSQGLDKITIFKINGNTDRLKQILVKLAQDVPTIQKLSFELENELTMLPAEIANLTALTDLDLRGNKLTSIPDSIGGLTALTNLILSHNKLTSIPDSIGRLTALTRLDLRDNKLTFIPNSIGGLTALTRLDLRANKLTFIPNSIGGLTALTDLDLYANKLTSIPDSIGDLTSLAQLNVCYNHTLASLPLPNSMINRSHQLAFVTPRTPQMLAQTARNLTSGIQFEAEDVMVMPHDGGNPATGGQEALTAMRNEITQRWRTYAQSHTALLTELMPAKVDAARDFSELYPELSSFFNNQIENYTEEKEGLFISLNTKQNQELLARLLRLPQEEATTLKRQHPNLDQLQTLSIERKENFRLVTALRGLKLLNGDPQMPTHHISTHESYRNREYQGMPNTLQLVVFLYRVLQQKTEETYIRKWLAEKFARGMEKFPLKTHFPQGSIGEVLASDKSPLLISGIMEVHQKGDNINRQSIIHKGEVQPFYKLCKKIWEDRKSKSSL
jgi:hypothetical protein